MNKADRIKALEADTHKKAIAYTVAMNEEAHAKAHYVKAMSRTAKAGKAFIAALKKSRAAAPAKC